MGLFDIWRPGEPSQKKRPEPSGPFAPFALPQKAQKEAEHLLPGPPPVPAPAKPKSTKELFADFSAKEPPAPKKPSKSLVDALIPESERGGIYRGRQEAFERESGPAPERRVERAERDAEIYPRLSRQTYGWKLPTPEEFAGRLPAMFNLDLVWDEARSGRRLPWFRNEAKIAYQSGEAPALPLVAVAPASDYDVLGYFFGIPRHVMDSYLEGVPRDQEVHAANQFWDEILWPLFDMTTAAFELLKPEDLPGWFRLDVSQTDPSLIELQYLEMSR